MQVLSDREILHRRIASMQSQLAQIQNLDIDNVTDEEFVYATGRSRRWKCSECGTPITKAIMFGSDAVDTIILCRDCLAQAVSTLEESK